MKKHDKHERFCYFFFDVLRNHDYGFKNELYPMIQTRKDKTKIIPLSISEKEDIEKTMMMPEREDNRMTQVLRDRNGRKIGEIIENGKKKIIKNAFGHKLGEFDGKVTRDECGRLVGTSDLLTSLLK